MRPKRVSKARSAGRVFLALVSALFMSPLAAESEPDRCPGVSLQAEVGLALGTVRTQPGARGFLELHPRHGISVSNDGVVHQGPWGSAELLLLGPPEHRITLELILEQTSEHDDRGLKLAELILLDGGETRRLDADGETLKLRLPDREGPDGRARMRLEIGAVAAFRHHSNPQRARYRLAAACLSVAP